MTDATKDDAGKPGVTEPKAEGKATPKAKAGGKAMKHFISSSDTYVGGKVYHAGEPFVSDAEPGADWEEVSASDAAAAETSTNAIPSDEVFDAASKEAVEAFCLIKGVDIRGLKTKEEFVTAAKAWNDPTR